MSIEKSERKIPVYCWRCGKLIRYEVCDECGKVECRPSVDEFIRAMDGFHDTVTRRLNDYNRLALTIVEMLLLLHFGNVVYHTFHLISGREYEKIREAAEKRFDEVKEIVVGLIDIGL
ncbi:MAG: hypothetical protein NDF52_05355 [archaeon YNP-WB-062]|nr:hypothetical protein [Candidatus Culexarchaeum yellowstonense]